MFLVLPLHGDRCGQTDSIDLSPSSTYFQVGLILSGHIVAQLDPIAHVLLTRVNQLTSTVILWTAEQCLQSLRCTLQYRSVTFNVQSPEVTLSGRAWILLAPYHLR